MPGIVTLGTIDVTTVTATALTGGTTVSATDTTRVGQEIAVQPNYSRNAVAGSVNFYGHTVTNNGQQAASLNITATSAQGWTVLLWRDDNRNGVHEVSSPNEPAVSNPVTLNPGETYWLVAEIQVAGNATAGTVDQTVIHADSVSQPGPSGAATDTTTVFVNNPPIIDGKYDDIYNTSPDSQVVCYNDPAGTLFGKLATFYQSDGDSVYMVLAIDKDFVDNTYGTNAVGWPSGHTFGNLVGSDHAQFYGYNANGTKVLDFKLDYITANPSGTTTPSGYSALGVTGGEGRMNLGSASSILDWGTSIDYSLNDLGYCAGGNCAILGTNLVVNSPATNQFYTPNTTYPGWIYDVIYEVKISRGAFTGGFGRLEVPYIHASPSKLGTNTIYATPGPCPGEIGDFVWHDVDRDGIQDSGEPGIDNVRLNLYRDNGNGLFDSATDTLVGYQITTAGGKYLFQNLAANDYWVQVVESTVPVGYTTTTSNSPMLVSLGEGESYLNADFGYAMPLTPDYGDAPDTGAGTSQGNYNTLSTDNGPKHTIVSTLKLGRVAPDGDPGTLQNADATADNLSNINDEDGVTLLPVIAATSTSEQLTVTASNTGSTPATLACWIDFNRDGDFLDTGERASTTVPANAGTADYNLTFTGFAAPTAGTSYLRCRIAYNATEVANPTGAATSGEVEDYRLTIQTIAVCPTDGVSLGGAAQYAVFGVNDPGDSGGGQVARFSSVVVTGSAAMASGVALQVDDASTVNGNLFLDTGATWNNNPTRITGSVLTGQDLSNTRLQAIYASQMAATLVPTQSFGTINTNLTINGVAGTNVVEIAAIDLNNQTLTLNAPADSWFILNLSGQLKLAGASAIALAGGITPSNVLINMTGSGGLINIAGGTSGTFTTQVSASSDDAEEEGPDGLNLGPGGMYLDSTDLEMVTDLEPAKSGTQKIGLRFNGVAVPKGATITNAYLTFRAVAPDSPNTNTGATSLTIRGQAADNPTTFTSTKSDITNRTTTSASVAWPSIPSWTTGTNYNTPGLQTIVQENVNRSGWASGNSMVFIVTGSGSRSAESWDDTPANQPRLTIEYTTGTPTIAGTILGINVGGVGTDPTIGGNFTGALILGGDFNLATNANVTYQGFVRDLCLDFGDAPDTGPGTGQGNYNTLSIDSGPSHVTVAGLRLGNVAPDEDSGTLQNTAASADDTSGADDEDGIATLPSINAASTSVPLAVSAVNSTGLPATLACWIDFNRDGDFLDTGEKQSAAVASQAGIQTINLTFTGFAAPVVGDSYLRCRIANVASEVANPTGAANTGEVEDYKVTIAQQLKDYGDAPDTGAGTAQGNYNTLATDNGPSHAIVNGLSLGPIAPDADPGTLQNIDNSADDDTNAADEDGISVLPEVTVGSSSVALAVQALNATGSPATVACWIDFNRNGSFTDAGERASGGLSFDTGVRWISLTFSGYGTPVAGDSYLRCRVANDASQVALPTGAASTGEVEDYKISISAEQRDFGDAPDANAGTAQGDYNTRGSDNGPSHVIVSGIYLGVVAPDSDPGTLQGLDALADDLDNYPPNDEDGIEFLPNVTTATTEVLLPVQSTNATGSTAYLACWIDFNRDGDFLDNGERSQTQLAAANSGAVNYDLLFNGFGAPTAGLSYVRCRIAQNQADIQNSTGAAQSGEVEDYVITISPFDINQLGEIGNYVWVDENSDGYQDAGEPGIANVTVVLYGVTGVEVARTVTDSHGKYLFSDLPQGAYYVDVLDGTGSQAYTLPISGMTQTPPSTLPGADGGNQNHGATAIPNSGFSGYRVTLPEGGENLTADFGYNYNTQSCVQTNTCSGAIGDRVWIDADGDGRQDAEEPGLAGVEIKLYHDPDGNGVYDTLYPGGTTTTDQTGLYLFDELPPGGYVVRVTPPNGYTQTGDPDQWGLPCTTCDNQTTTPVVIGPGDVFLNADFGYQPPTSQSNTIGDMVWFDADADGIGPAGTPGGTDTNEYGIPGVTVALIRDTNDNGVWNAGEPIIAVDTTDASGMYLFTGLPDGSYLVWVNDTNNVTGARQPTYDADGGTISAPRGAPLSLASNTVQGLSSVLNLGVGNSNAASNLAQDFGYTAGGQEPNKGLIGDRVWLDINGNGFQNANEPGIEGVRVELRASVGDVVAVTYTDENGYYYFGGLQPGTYTVAVTPPPGMSQTYDYDGLDTPHQSTVAIGGANPLINLDQDFGYRGTTQGTIGDLVWRDLNANGVVNAGETGISGVTLDLYWDLNGNGKVDPGEPLVGKATTNASGAYLFSGLPTDDGDGNAQFVVDVTDVAGVLAGYWHSLGIAGQNNNSQTDPYAVTLTPDAPNNLTADFGYYVLPAAIGNYVWADADANGIQNPGEPPLTGVVVMLTITYPGAGPGGGDLTVALKTATDGTGYYSFGNLLLDEHTPPNTGAPTPPAPPQPSFSISAVTPSGSSPTITNAVGATACADNATFKCNDSDNPAGTTATPLKGQTDASLANTTSSIASYDFGFTSTPTAVALRGLAASTAVPMALPLGAVALTVLGVFTWWVRRQR